MTYYCEICGEPAAEGCIICGMELCPACIDSHEENCTDDGLEI